MHQPLLRRLPCQNPQPKWICACKIWRFCLVSLEPNPPFCGARGSRTWRSSRPRGPCWRLRRRTRGCRRRTESFAAFRAAPRAAPSFPFGTSRSGGVNSKPPVYSQPLKGEDGGPCPLPASEVGLGENTCVGFHAL